MSRRWIPSVLISLVAVATASFGVGVAAAAAPSNNAFASAEVLTASGSIVRSNVGATRQANEPDPSCCTMDATIWFKWTAPATSRVTFHTGGSDIDTMLAVYTGTTLSSVVEVASDDDGFGCGYASVVQFDAVKGQVYDVQLGSWDTSITSPNLHLTWNWHDRPQRVNDDVANATVLPATAASTVTNGDNSGSTAEPAGWAGEDYGQSSTWYVVNAPQAGVVSVGLATATTPNVWGQTPAVAAEVWGGDPTFPSLLGSATDGQTITVGADQAGPVWIQMYTGTFCEGGAFALTTSYAPGTPIDTYYDANDFPIVSYWANREGMSLSKFQHDSVFALAFLYGLAGTTPTATTAPAPGTVDVASAWPTTDAPTLTWLGAGWHTTTDQTERVAADVVAFLLSLSGG